MRIIALLYAVLATVPVAGAEAVRVTLAAVGDLMCHDTQLKAAGGPGGFYSFDPCFEPVSPVLRSADLAVGNLEVVCAGPGPGFRGYPCFNAPDAYALALKRAGFDLLTTANNHSFDYGYKGIVRTTALLDLLGFYRTGTFGDLPRISVEPGPPFVHFDPPDAPCVVPVKGLKVGVVAGTAILNGPVPRGQEGRIRLVDTGPLAEDIRRLRDLPPPQRPDLVVAFVHWGEEYKARPSAHQRGAAKRLLEAGADVVIGSHPHVLQGVEWVTVERGGRPFTGFVAYSLGNFISGQRTPPRERGAILWLVLEKDARTGVACVTSVSFIPTYVVQSAGWGPGKFVVWPVEAALAGMAAGDLRTPPASMAPFLRSVLQEVSAVFEDARGLVRRMAWAGAGP